MSRTTEKMDQVTAHRALRMVGKEVGEIGDTVVRGLSIRIRKTAATWCLRGRLGDRQSIWTIGPVGTASTPGAVSLTEARRRAMEAKNKLRNGEDPAGWLQEQQTGGPIVRTFDPTKDGLTWEEGRQNFLAHIKENRRPETYRDYRTTLLSRDFEPFRGRLIKSLNDDDARRLRDSILDRGKPTQSKHSLTILKSMLSWLSDRADTGVKTNVAAGVKSPKERSTGKGSGRKGRVPTLEALGRVAWNLAASSAPAARLAGAMILFTGQRALTVRKARVEDFRLAEDGEPAWIISHRKIDPQATNTPPGEADRPHVIPTPPILVHIIEQAIALLPEDARREGWLFPQTRLRRQGEGGGGYISHNFILDAFRAAGGTDATHDMRRAVATHGESLLGWKLAEIKLILDHSQGLGGDVTAAHYAMHDRSRLTRPLMEEWCEFVLEQTVVQDPDKAGMLPAFLTLRA